MDKKLLWLAIHGLLALGTSGAWLLILGAYRYGARVGRFAGAAAVIAAEGAASLPPVRRPARKASRRGPLDWRGGSGFNGSRIA